MWKCFQLWKIDLFNFSQISQKEWCRHYFEFSQKNVRLVRSYSSTDISTWYILYFIAGFWILPNQEAQS